MTAAVWKCRHDDDPAAVAHGIAQCPAESNSANRGQHTQMEVQTTSAEESEPAKGQLAAMSSSVPGQHLTPTAAP